MAKRVVVPIRRRILVPRAAAASRALDATAAAVPFLAVTEPVKGLGLAADAGSVDDADVGVCGQGEAVGEDEWFFDDALEAD